MGSPFGHPTATQRERARRRRAQAQQRVHSHTTPSPSPSLMNSYAGYLPRAGAIPCLRVSTLPTPAACWTSETEKSTLGT